MDMRLVERATLFNAICGLTLKSGGPMIDLMRDYDLDHQGRMYVSVQAATEMGALVGLVSKDQLDALSEELAQANALIEALEEQLTQAGEFARAIDVIESANFTARKKRGPKVAA